MTIKSEIQSLSPSALVELFELDATNVGGDEIIRFHAGTNSLVQPIVWQGNTYVCLPAEAEGFDLSSKGTLPRPRIRMADAGGLIGSNAKKSDDLVGCRVRRIRTFAKYLDAINFPGGVNPTADPNQYLPFDVWFVAQKTSANGFIIEWELESAFDFQGIMLPFRQVIQNTCTWRYRGPDCGYAGDPFDTNDKPCSLENDYCAKRLSSCLVRHGANVDLPYGGHPGATRAQS